MKQTKLLGITLSDSIVVSLILFGVYAFLGIVLWIASTYPACTTPFKKAGIHCETGEQSLEEQVSSTLQTTTVD